MPEKLKSFSALFAFTLLVIAASSVVAQVDRPVKPIPQVPTLPCCKCLGGTSSLDLSTISSNQWIVNGSPAVFLNTIDPAWNINPGPAQWVSTTASGGTSSISAGPYVYQLRFMVPKCTIEQRVTLTGNYGGDNNVSVFLDNNSTPLSQCTGNYCFNIPHHPSAPTFNTLVSAGVVHTLVVKVQNNEGPSGMFVNAKLTSTCRN